MVSHVSRPLAEAASWPGGAVDADWTREVGGWPSRRPSLAYQWALDASAAEAYRRQCPPMLVAAHPVLGPEAARRLGLTWTVPSEPDTRDAAPTVLETRIVGADPPTEAHADAAPTLLWIEPTAGNWRPTLAQAERFLRGAGYLLVLTSSPWLARGLPEWGVCAPHARNVLLGGWSVHRRLRAAHWSVEATFGFRGLRGLSLGALAGLAAMLRRDALADRLSVQMRQHFVERGLLARFSTVTLIGARPPFGQHGTRGGSR